MIRDTLGPTLRAMRERAGLSGAELGRRIGTSRSFVSQIERGHVNPGAESLFVWAEACGERLTFVAAGEPLPPSTCAEARDAADILEAASPEDRALYLTVLRRMAGGGK